MATALAVPAADSAASSGDIVFSPQSVDPLPLGQSSPLSSAFVPAAVVPATMIAMTTVQVDTVAPSQDIPIPPTAPASAPIPEVSTVAVPLPASRPHDFNPSLVRSPTHFGARRAPQDEIAAAAPPAPPDNRSFLEKFFGMPRSSGPRLAYAAPEDGLLGNTRGAIVDPALPHDRWTAVYNIAAHTVYMPDGTRLEAHSGLGDLLDDPRHVDARNRGATPPHLYDLEPRAQLFHGVQALRLNPVGGSGVFGRTGLLAHTYMLGPKGDSNGCVSFRDYNAFLQAYANGQVRRLVVVAGVG